MLDHTLKKCTLETLETAGIYSTNEFARHCVALSSDLHGNKFSIKKDLQGDLAEFTVLLF